MRCHFRDLWIVRAASTVTFLMAAGLPAPAWSQEPAIRRAIRLTSAAEVATKEPALKRRLKSACGRQEDILSLLRAKRKDQAIELLDGVRSSLLSVVAERPGEKSELNEKVNHALRDLD